MHLITRKLEFDSAHRVLGHESKCKFLHGHRYVAEVSVSALGLDDLSRVVDFGVVKSLVGAWINENWDHNILLNQEDPLLRLSWDSQLSIFGEAQPYCMPAGLNPTAEVIADQLLIVSRSLLVSQYKLRVERVRIYETPNCWADAT